MTAIEREIDIARRDGVNNQQNLPFLLVPDQPSGHGILLVHGFTATPHEMRPLAERLYQQGDTVFAVRLPGHGTSPADLAKKRYEEWLDAVDRGYQLLADRGLSVTGVGQSTGALLLLNLAHSHHFDALVLLSPFLRLRHWLAPFAGLLHRWFPYQTRPLAPEEQRYYYLQRPLQGVHQINRLRHRIKNILQRITTPALILAAEGDETVAPGTGKILFDKLGSNDKEFHIFGKDVPHVLTTSSNPRLQEVFTLIEEFLAKRLKGGK
jgi:carboxylesterase